MLRYWLGIPGSGKTYQSVDNIYNNFSPDVSKKTLKKDYEVCYTNINGFNFDKVENVKPLDFDELLEKLTVLYNLYKAKESDSVLIEKAKELNIYKAYFVIDECHNYFDTQKSVLVWWLTYHRHLYHDIDLITQNLALVNSKYKPLAEAFYRAKPRSMTFNPTEFHYTYFVDSRLTQSGKVNVLKLKKRKEVFALYHSGDSVASKNVIFRFVFIALAVFLVLILMGWFFYHSKQKEIQKDKNVTAASVRPLNIASSVLNSSLSASTDLTDYKYIEVECLRDMCTYDDVEFPVTFFMDADKKYDLRLVGTSKRLGFKVLYIYAPSAFMDAIDQTKGNYDVQDNNTPRSIIHKLI